MKWAIMKWAIKHKSGRVLFVTSDEFIADNRRKMGWIVEEVKMTSRERFEHECRNGLINGGLATFDNGVYVSELTKAVWAGWQASRSGIEIELKQFDHFQICHYGAEEKYADGYIDAQNNASKAIEQAGLKVKK